MVSYAKPNLAAKLETPACAYGMCPAHVRDTHYASPPPSLFKLFPVFGARSCVAQCYPRSVFDLNLGSGQGFIEGQMAVRAGDYEEERKESSAKDVEVVEK